MEDPQFEKNLEKESEKQSEYRGLGEEREPENAVKESKEFTEEREMAPQAEIQQERERTLKKPSQAQFTPQEEAEAKRETVKIKKMDSHGKLQRLLTIAKDKGVVFAIKVARDLGDPYALDMLHDILAQDENYKKLK